MKSYENLAKGSQSDGLAAACGALTLAAAYCMAIQEIAWAARNASYIIDIQHNNLSAEREPSNPVLAEQSCAGTENGSRFSFCRGKEQCFSPAGFEGSSESGESRRKASELRHCVLRSPE